MIYTDTLIGQDAFDVFETVAADSLVTAQAFPVRASFWSSLVAQIARTGFDKRIRSVDAVPCGDGNLLHCIAV